MEEKYHSLKTYLKNKFGTRVHRITLEANLDCPNRDGNKAFGGCTFCTADGSGAGTFSVTTPIQEQLNQGVELFSKRFRAEKFIAYLQSFTNTYSSIENLKKIYDESISHKDVAILAIGTRPDCLSEEVLDLIESYKDKVEIWLDVGLQTIHNQTLDRINRAHTYEDFVDALERAKKRDLAVCTHTIFGLPGETEKMFYETMKEVASLPIDAIKIHQLLVLEKTKMAAEFQMGLITPMDCEKYVSLVCDFLEILPQNVVIHRLFAEAKKNELISPAWAEKSHGGRNKQELLKKINNELEKRNSKQACKYVTIL